LNYLQIVQKALLRAGVRDTTPITLIGATDIVADFAEWAQDSWRELQEESTNWWFRQKLDQTLTINASDDEYAMPAGLETLNYRTVTLFTTAKEDERHLDWIDYERWRLGRDTRSFAEGPPNQITERPDGVIQIFPVPDKAYTMRFDGVWDIDEMTADVDTPGDTISGGTQLLPDRYHFLLVWDTVKRYAEHHGDPDALVKAQTKQTAQHARLTEKQKPPVRVAIGRLTGLGSSYGRY